jgi:parallel beta-helix repeat protein
MFMWRKEITFCLVILITLSSIVIIVDIAQVVKAPTMFYVDDVPGSSGPEDPPEDFTSIQEAINASSDGDTVFVYNGTYYENVIVNKAITLNGENRNSTVVDAGWDHDAILVTSDSVNISGFTVTHSGSQWYDAGIDLNGVEDCRISDNIAVDNNCGFMLYYSNKSTLSGNNASGNWANGIFLRSTHNNTITDNNASFSDKGIYVLYSYDTTVMGNIGWHNGYGIQISNSGNTTIDHNCMYNSWDAGIYLYYSSVNRVLNNTVPSYFNGIYSYNSNKSNIVNNTVHSCNNYGIAIRNSNNITLHHNNIMNNRYQAYFSGSSSDIIWDDGMGEGNYWSDYTGLDDGSNGRTAKDGVGDTEIPHPYIDQGNGYFQLDNYPLMDPTGDYIILYNDWNFVSIPLVQQETDLGTVLSSIAGKYGSVQFYDTTDSDDPWKNHNLKKPAELNDLDDIDITMGIWIEITQVRGALLEYSGGPPVVNQTIMLKHGWNMVGYPSLTRHNRTMGLNNLVFGTDVDAIQWFDSSSESWHFLGSEDFFSPGKGYWVHSKVETTWEVPL